MLNMMDHWHQHIGNETQSVNKNNNVIDKKIDLECTNVVVV
jgi:hypothetical protein